MVTPHCTQNKMVDVVVLSEDVEERSKGDPIQTAIEKGAELSEPEWASISEALLWPSGFACSYGKELGFESRRNGYKHKFTVRGFFLPNPGF